MPSVRGCNLILNSTQFSLASKPQQDPARLNDGEVKVPDAFADRSTSKNFISFEQLPDCEKPFRLWISKNRTIIEVLEN
ncbi:MAG: hypothetical protein M3421_08600, partial [Bacteroidota bacterium]|nr:hypothetical protein [Bacteroidota bacterium]